MLLNHQSSLLDQVRACWLGFGSSAASCTEGTVVVRRSVGVCMYRGGIKEVRMKKSNSNSVIGLCYGESPMKDTAVVPANDGRDEDATEKDALAAPPPPSSDSRLGLLRRVCSSQLS